MKPQAAVNLDCVDRTCILNVLLTQSRPHAVDLRGGVLVGWRSSAHDLVLMHLGLGHPTTSGRNGHQTQTHPDLQGGINGELSLHHDLRQRALVGPRPRKNCETMTTWNYNAKQLPASKYKFVCAGSLFWMSSHLEVPLCLIISNYIVYQYTAGPALLELKLPVEATIARETLEPEIQRHVTNCRSSSRMGNGIQRPAIQKRKCVHSQNSRPNGGVNTILPPKGLKELVDFDILHGK